MAKISQLPAAGAITGTEQILGVQGGITKRFSASALKGVKGDTGPKGDTGDTGPQGIQGIQGVKGDTGAAGATGATGPKGDTGLQGPAGVAGIDGADGEVAEAPVDGKQYARKDAAWAEVAASGGGHIIVNGDGGAELPQRSKLIFTAANEGMYPTFTDYEEDDTTAIDIPWPVISDLLDNPPASATSTGDYGSMAVDTDYLYICVANDTWKRVALETWT